MKLLAALLWVAIAMPASAEDRIPDRSDCAHPSCTCVDAEASHDCLDADGCAAFCEAHGGVAQTIHSGYNLPPKPRAKPKKKPAK